MHDHEHEREQTEKADCPGRLGALARIRDERRADYTGLLMAENGGSSIYQSLGSATHD
ncbi:MAG TPA: hypothetical protein VMJ11_20870 [Paraburkholderia sp.]|uniref:hypothetical protein n=1 Tax=Paraburkholderia sp. TaxID=1926495 RepID=UPI002B799832|nr:hypothetical protein [Paraburkholderia sp.]HTR09056.1 hypothetical protein [Paraburkholderia sp.]